jgi:16S rRNA (adenine1518-N6/adenine1519-N6)-dimethyltransferase
VPRPLGQHFLYQEAILERIAFAVCGEDHPPVIEIGPGPGTLTAHLLPRASHLTAIEIDAALASALRARYLQAPGFTLIEGDVLAQDLSRWAPAVVCGNIPYYITSPIVEKALALGPLLMRAVFLVQREVANRLAASPGNRDYGYLSVIAQVQCRVQRLFVVKPASFRPPPKVDSAVVLLTPHSAPLCPDLPAFRRFASLCFRQKRKTLRNNLAGVVPLERLEDLPEAGLRAEQLSVPELLRLARTLGVLPA